ASDIGYEFSACNGLYVSRQVAVGSRQAAEMGTKERLRHAGVCIRGALALFDTADRTMVAVTLLPSVAARQREE
ncbi:MAG: hypothetical protein ABI389_05210, partial [Rhodanobacter sp.]